MVLTTSRMKRVESGERNYSDGSQEEGGKAEEGWAEVGRGRGNDHLEVSRQGRGNEVQRGSHVLRCVGGPGPRGDRRRRGSGNRQRPKDPAPPRRLIAGKPADFAGPVKPAGPLGGPAGSPAGERCSLRRDYRECRNRAELRGLAGFEQPSDRERAWGGFTRPLGPSRLSLARNCSCPVFIMDCVPDPVSRVRFAMLRGYGERSNRGTGTDV